MNCGYNLRDVKGGSKVNVTMTLIFPKIVWKCPLSNMIKMYKLKNLVKRRLSLSLMMFSQQSTNIIGLDNCKITALHSLMWHMLSGKGSSKGLVTLCINKGT